VTEERTLSTVQVVRPKVTVRRPGKFVLRVVHGPTANVHQLEVPELD
jgi:hypothetical protein